MRQHEWVSVQQPQGWTPGPITVAEKEQLSPRVHEQLEVVVAFDDTEGVFLREEAAQIVGHGWVLLQDLVADGLLHRRLKLRDA